MSVFEDFILENTGWMVTIAIIISLALIGYIADSNGFMSKDKAKKTSKPKKPKKQVSKENKKDKKNKKAENNAELETEVQQSKEENAILVETPTVEEPVEEEILEKTRPLNIEKDFQKLMEDDDDVPSNIDEEKIDDELWKF